MTKAPPKKEGALVFVDQDGPVSVLALNSPPHNLIGPSLMSALLNAVDDELKRGARCIVIKSALRNFCAGADITLFEKPAEKPKEDLPEGPSILEFLQRMEAIPVPVIASVNGACLGGGLEIALTADYIIAARSSRIGSVEITLGLNPIMGGIQRQVERVGLVRAKEMSMLGRRYDPSTLERWNLINHVVDDEQLDETTIMIAKELGHGPTVAHASTKSIALVAANEGIAAADAQMAQLQKPVWKSDDLKNGLTSLIRRGPGLARFEGK